MSESSSPMKRPIHLADRLPPAFRKAAILISTLDTRSADALLDKMQPETANLVRQTVMELDDVSTEEQNEVIREFMRAGGKLGEEDLDGVELDPSLTEKFHSSDLLVEPAVVPAAPHSPPPFQFLRDATAAVLARHLERQHPQLIAVVASHLPPAQAAEVIKRLTPKLQADVLRRVAELDVADQEIVREVEQELELLLRDELRLQRTRQQGLAAVSTILNAAGNERHALLDTLSQHQGDLALQLHGANRPSATRPLVDRSRQLPTPGLSSKRRQSSPVAAAVAVPSESRRSVERQVTSESKLETDRADRMPHPALPLRTEPSGPELAFEELASLGDEEWAILIGQVDPQLLLLALTGASEPLLQRIQQCLSRREARALHRRLQQTGPLRLSDIERAQHQLAQVARELVARGKIVLPRRRNFAAAA